ncbi:MAG TPA: hypothetical protein VJB12_02845, partial [Candidatus Nanoarchaeia archaeon]|nr:hypothetical protein [Candidatus Nanoarchaeia archaeon]
SFMLNYLVFPAKKERRKKEGEGELERALTLTKVSALDEIRRSIDSIVKKAEWEDGSIAEGKFAKVSGSSFSYAIQRKSSLSRNYSVSVKYHSTDEEDRIDVSIAIDEQSESETIIRSTSKHIQRKDYSFTISRKKEIMERKGYEVHATYLYSKGQEEAAVEYRAKSYAERLNDQKGDFSERVPFKVLHMKPKNQMGGALGYTFLGESYMAMRDDLQGELKREVDIHESIHTPNEYETRVLTWWMMQKPKIEYKGLGK